MIGRFRIGVLYWAEILASYTMWVMMTYLTDVWKLHLTHAAAIVNVYSGLVAIMPIFMAYLVDTCLGNYGMLVLSSVSYSIGLSFLAMSTPPVLSKVTGTCSAYEPACIGNIQYILFYAALVLIAGGQSGYSISLQSFSDENQREEDRQSLLKVFMLILVAVVAVIVIPYIKPWSVTFGIPAICSVVATLIFLSGSYSYTYIKPPGCQRRASQMYENSDLSDDDLLPQTTAIRCEEEAVVTITSSQIVENQENKGWMLCSPTEETKTILRIIPMSMFFIVIGVVISIGNTYFLEQATHMNRKVWFVHVPIQILLYFQNKGKSKNNLGEIFDGTIPSALLVSSPLFNCVVCCITAALVEAKRLRVVEQYGLIDKPDDTIPMSILWMVPLFLLLGTIEGSAENLIQKFFADEVPNSMERYLPFFTNGVLGAGSIFSVLSVFAAEKFSERGGRLSWFQDNLNKSHLDNYYWALTVLSSINYVVYFLFFYFFYMIRGE